MRMKRIASLVVNRADTSYEFAVDDDGRVLVVLTDHASGEVFPMITHLKDIRETDSIGQAWLNVSPDDHELWEDVMTGD